jgi:hypothetical protein
MYVCLPDPELAVLVFSLCFVCALPMAHTITSKAPNRAGRLTANVSFRVREVQSDITSCVDVTNYHHTLLETMSQQCVMAVTGGITRMNDAHYWQARKR